MGAGGGSAFGRVHGPGLLPDRAAAGQGFRAAVWRGRGGRKRSGAHADARRPRRRGGLAKRPKLNKITGVEAWTHFPAGCARDAAGKRPGRDGDATPARHRRDGRAARARRVRDVGAPPMRRLRAPTRRRGAEYGSGQGVAGKRGGRRRGAPERLEIGKAAHGRHGVIRAAEVEQVAARSAPEAPRRRFGDSRAGVGRGGTGAHLPVWSRRNPTLEGGSLMQVLSVEVRELVGSGTAVLGRGSP